MMFGYINHYHSLDLMSEAISDDTESIPGLPSWVPDWTQPMPVTDPTSSNHLASDSLLATLTTQHVAFRATIVCKELYDTNPDVLRVAGKVQGEVDWVSEPLGGLDFHPIPLKRRAGILEKLWEDVMARLGRSRETRHALLAYPPGQCQQNRMSRQLTSCIRIFCGSCTIRKYMTRMQDATAQNIRIVRPQVRRKKVTLQRLCIGSERIWRRQD